MLSLWVNGDRVIDNSKWLREEFRNFKPDLMPKILLLQELLKENWLKATILLAQLLLTTTILVPETTSKVMLLAMSNQE